MAGFVYYLPSAKESISSDEVRAAGLGYAFESVGPDKLRFTARGTTRGPSDGGSDGPAGVVIGDLQRMPAGRLGYFPDVQTWRQVPQSAVWVGYCTAEKPTPAELKRSTVLAGHPVALGDGREWEIPIVRGYIEQEGGPVPYMKLPRTVGLDEEGEFTPGDILPEYAAIQRGVMEYFDKLMAKARAAEGEKEIRFTVEDQVAVDLLATNYVVSRVEVVALGLFVWGGSQIWRILDAAIDVPGFEAIEKKRAAGGSSSDVGPPAATQDTTPA